LVQVVSVFLECSQHNATRIIGFTPKGSNRTSCTGPFFVQALGGAYAMGSRVFQRDNAEWQHGVSINLGVLQEATVLLFRLGGTPKKK